MQRILRFLIYAGLITPLLVLQSVFFPYITSKMFALEGVALLAGFLGLYLWCKDVKDYHPRATLLGITLLVFLAISFIAALVGIDFWRSFWSTYERMDGVFTWLCLILLFFTFSIASLKDNDWLWIFRVSLGVSIIIALQNLQFFGIFGQELVLPSRLSAIFNSPIYLGVYALFHTFIALVLLYLSGYTLQKSELFSILQGWRSVYFLGLLLNAIVLFLTFSRGPIVGFVLGIITIVVWYFLYGENKKTTLWGASFLIVVLALSFPFWGRSSLATRLSSIANGLGADETRVINWGVATKAFGARPLLGWGSNNYFFAQNDFFNPRLLLLTKEGFDRTHNKYLEIAVDSGLLGLISYLGIFVLCFFFLFKERAKQPFLSALLAGMLVAYLVQNITAFDNPGSYLPLFLMLAFIDAHFFPPLAYDVKLRPSLFIIGELIILALFWRGVWQPYQANLSLSQGLIRQTAPSLTQNYQQVLAYYRDALSYDTFGNYEMTVRLVMFVANEAQPPRDMVDFAINQTKTELENTNRDVFLQVALAKLYERAAVIEDNKDLFKNAQDAYRKAIGLSPTRTDSYEYYAIFLINQDRAKEARDILTKIKSVSPERFASDRIQWYWAMTYFTEQDFARAYDEFQKILTNNKTFPGGQEYLILGQTTYKLKKYSEMVHWYEELYRTDTQNPQYCIDLALAYREAGNNLQALDFAQRAMELDPRLADQAREFIKTLK